MAAISVILLVVSPPPSFGHVHTIEVVAFVIYGEFLGKLNI
jgi:hypothetical protein